jgi:anaerobic selenocysteine-containing dehydrogenase
MQAEIYDIMVTWGHLYFMLNQPAIEPPGECIANMDLWRRLAKTMGFDDEYWTLSDDEMLLRSYDWNAPALEGITLDILKRDGYKRLNVGTPDVRTPHKEGNFKTPSGKCEFAASAAANGNFVVEVWRSGYTEMQLGTPVDAVPNYCRKMYVTR